jgi:hypothetical protein
MTIFRSKKNGLLYLVWQLMGWNRGYVAEPYGHSVPVKHKKAGPGLSDTVKLDDFEPVAYR